MADYSKAHFLYDEEKMRDFELLTKEEFLESYSYLTEEEYDNTAELYENSITEWCPHCEEEVTLVGEFRVQKCPNCGEDILPCSICSGYNSGCFSCPLMTK